MINVLINGYYGKMGQVVKNEINLLDNLNVLCGYDKVENESENIFSDISKIDKIPDIIIDFSIPTATFEILKFAKKHNIPVVIATTGFSKEQEDEIMEYSRFIPIFKSSNMSYETNLMAKVVSNLALSLENSDIEIVETHHKHKIDSPSGTALLLANSINTALNNSKCYEYNRHSKKESRSKNEIGIHSIRGGTEVGKHSVLFFGDNESFEITHTVTSRAVFAKGAIKAAIFLVKQNAGFYNMNDLI